MKEYFSHDLKSRADRKMMNLRKHMGMEGLGIYWCLTEMLYEEEGYLDTDFDGIAYELGCDPLRVEEVINGYKLFSTDDEKFWSDSVLKRLDIRNSRSVKAKASADYRWGNTTQNANAMRTQCERIMALNTNIRENSIIEDKIGNNTHVILKFEDLKKELLESEIWIEETAMHLKADIPFLKQQLDIFLTDLKLKDDAFKPVNEVKSHFINWWRKTKPINNKPVSTEPEKFPDRWDRNYYENVCQDPEGYENHLKSLGFVGKFNQKVKQFEFIRP